MTTIDLETVRDLARLNAPAVLLEAFVYSCCRDNVDMISDLTREPSWNTQLTRPAIKQYALSMVESACYAATDDCMYGIDVAEPVTLDNVTKALIDVLVDACPELRTVEF